MRYFAVLLLVLASGLVLSGAEPNDCTFLQDPSRYQIDIQRTHRMRSDLTAQVAASASIAQPAVYASATTINPNALHTKTLSTITFSAGWPRRVFNPLPCRQTRSFCGG